MRKLIIAVLAMAFVYGCAATTQENAKADEYTSENRYGEPFKIRCTCYTAPKGAITASGSPVREGIVAGKSEWLNQCVAVMYDIDMNYIGIFEFKDTGAGIDTDGDGKGDSIKNGMSIDVYRDSLDRCYEWINTYGDYVYVQIVPGKG